MSRTCNDCGNTLGNGTKGNQCRACHYPPRQPKFCSCGVQINAKQNKSGLCKVCVLERNRADASLEARRVSAVRSAYLSPELRMARAQAIAEYNRTPEARERARQIGALNYHRTIGSDHAKRRANAPEVIAKRALTHSRNDLPWLPNEYRTEYFRERARVGARQAAANIKQRIAEAKRKELARFHVTDAADFMRKFAPIRRTDAGWQYGSTILTPEELIERAQLRGWKPFELRRAA